MKKIKKKREREGVEDENEREERESDIFLKKFLSLLLSQIYENRTVGFRRG